MSTHSFTLTHSLTLTLSPYPSTVRGPGKVSMIILLELMMQQLAATLGVDPDTFRTTHMIQLPPHVLTAAAAAEQAAAAAAPAGVDPPPPPTPPQQQQKASGVANPQQQQQEVSVPHPKYLPNSTSGDDSSDSSSSSSDSSSSSSSDSSSSKLETALGQVIELHQYTLPYMWQVLRQSSGYADRRAAVDAFNTRHSSRKRGLALVPVR